MSPKKLSVDHVLRELRVLYQPPRSFLNWTNPFELTIATLLSAQCTDDRVNLVTPALFKKYKKPQDYLKVPVEELAKDIGSITYFNSKAKYIQGLCRILLDKHNGEIPQTLAELRSLPGVGRKTATIVLWAAFGLVEGIPVDTHVLRLANRMGFSRSKNPDRVELDLIKQTEKKDWPYINPLLISHGRAVCIARDRKCESCVFQKECPSSKVMGRKDLAKET
jgi:endonuclease-3